MYVYMRSTMLPATPRQSMQEAHYAKTPDHDANISSLLLRRRRSVITLSAQPSGER